MERIESARSTVLEGSYDIVFIGGGPATLCFFSYLIKSCNFERFMKNYNILIIEKSEFFGSGCLGKYGINSNTSAEGFVRLICNIEEEKNKDNKYTLSPSKKVTSQNEVSKSTNSLATIYANQNSKSHRDKFLNPFHELFFSLPTQVLITLGSKPAPLALIGNFLNCIGNTIADISKRQFDKKILMTNSEVLGISVSDINKEHVGLKEPNNYNYEITIKKTSRQNKTTIVKSKIVIFASGAKQKFDQFTKKEILKMINPADFYHSDYILQEQGYCSLINNLKSKKSNKIIIIGGSHSGFACAWMLINSPADWKKIKLNKEYTNYKQKYDDNCGRCKTENCCNGSTSEKYWNTIGNTGNTIYTNNSNNTHSGNKSNSAASNEYEIYILYRDHIKVYYHSEKEALNDGYNIYDPKKCVNKNGNVYPFIGIRGDAKEMYRRITKGNEKRIKLIKITSLSYQNELFQNVAAVIWAGGYTTERIKILDKKSETEIKLYDDNNFQYEVDKELHLMTKEKLPIFSLLGIGQGYSTHSIEILNNGKNARADSVNLYNTYIAKKLIKTIESLIPIVKKENTFSTNKSQNTVIGLNKKTEENPLFRSSMGHDSKKINKNTIENNTPLREKLIDNNFLQKSMNNFKSKPNDMILSTHNFNMSMVNTNNNKMQREKSSFIKNIPNNKNSIVKSSDYYLNSPSNDNKSNIINYNLSIIINKSKNKFNNKSTQMNSSLNVKQYVNNTPLVNKIYNRPIKDNENAEIPHLSYLVNKNIYLYKEVNQERASSLNPMRDDPFKNMCSNNLNKINKTANRYLIYDSTYKAKLSPTRDNKFNIYSMMNEKKSI